MCKNKTVAAWVIASVAASAPLRNVQKEAFTSEPISGRKSISSRLEMATMVKQSGIRRAKGSL